jgi:hypothetical protein
MTEEKKTIRIVSGSKNKKRKEITEDYSYVQDLTLFLQSEDNESIKNTKCQF